MTLPLNEVWQAVENLAQRALDGFLGDKEKALETIIRVAVTNGMREEVARAVIAAVKQDGPPYS